MAFDSRKDEMRDYNKNLNGNNNIIDYTKLVA